MYTATKKKRVKERSVKPNPTNFSLDLIKKAANAFFFLLLLRRLSLSKSQIDSIRFIFPIR